jgi:hypothetical protein
MQVVAESLQGVTQQRAFWTIEPEINFDIRRSMAEFDGIIAARQALDPGT